MKKPLALAPLIFLGLASAAPPPRPMGPGPEAAGPYPPCSAAVTDRCIQLYERGVRRHSAYRDMPPPPPPDMAPPPILASGGDYPPCTAERQDRCTQLPSRHAPTRYAMADRERIRIGERG